MANTHSQGMYHWTRVVSARWLGLCALVWLAMLSSLTAADAPSQFEVGEFKFSRPEKWEWVQVNSPMRKAHLKLPGTTGQETAEVVFFHFGPGNGGGTQANVDRWLGQFKEPKDQIQAKTEEKTVGGHKITYVQGQGTYMSGMPGGPKTPQTDTMLLGAIIEGEGGSVFIRLTAPIRVAKAETAAFRTMAESGLKK